MIIDYQWKEATIFTACRVKEVVMMFSKGCMPSCILCMLFIIICACANFNLLLFVHC